MRAPAALVLATIGAMACSEPQAPAPVAAPARETPAPEVVDGTRDARTVVWIGGDVLPSGAMRRVVRDAGDQADGFAQILAPLSSRLARDGRSAFVLVNLETPVAAEMRVDNDAFTRTKVGERLVPAPLNAPEWMLTGLARAGVDAVMLANNHTLDQGRQGLRETIEAAQRAGLVTTGAGLAPHLGWPVVVGEPGADVAILTYLERDFAERELPAGMPGVSVFGPDAIDAVAREKEERAAVVVVVHVVAELEHRVDPTWRAHARELADAGADAVVIHGQHVPAPVETIRASDGREVVVAHGIGNLFSDMGVRARPGRDPEDPEDKWERPETREGLLVRIEVATGTRPRVSFLPIFTDTTHFLVYNGVLPGPPTFSVVPFAVCGAPIERAGDVPEDLQEDLGEWLVERRDHLFTTTGLHPSGCDGLLPSPAFRGTM